MHTHKDIHNKLEKFITEEMLYAEHMSFPKIKRDFEWSLAQSQCTYQIKYRNFQRGSPTHDASSTSLTSETSGKGSQAAAC
jgi:hypothetical protein